MRLPQGPWFPWSREFRWDRLPWQATTAREARARRDQQDLIVLVEAAATTIGAVATNAGFTFRPDASGIGFRNDEREVALLYEADPGELADRFPAMEVERDQPCVDLWIYWSPETGRLDISGPQPLDQRDLRTLEPVRDSGALHATLGKHATTLARTLGRERG